MVRKFPLLQFPPQLTIHSGGGVGGLTLAVALSKAPNIEVDIYEAASEFAEIGAGVGVWPRTWKILQALGLADDLAAVADIPDAASPSASPPAHARAQLTDRARSIPLPQGRHARRRRHVREALHPR